MLGNIEFRPQIRQIPLQGAGADAKLLRCLVPRVAREAQFYGGAKARRQARNEPLAVDVFLHLCGDVYIGDAFGQRLQREAGMAFGVAVGVAGRGAEFLAAPAQGVGRVRVLPRVAAVLVVKGVQAGVCEVVDRMRAGGQSLRLPLQQPLRFAPFRDGTLRCVGHRRFPLKAVSKRRRRFLQTSRKSGSAKDCLRPRYRYSSQRSGRRRLSSVIGLMCPSTNATLANPPTICPSRIWLKWRGKTCP